MAVGALAYNIAVGKELACLLVEELLCCLLSQFAIVVELAEKFCCKLMVDVRCGAAVYVKRNAELLETVLYDVVVAVNYILRCDALSAGT